MGLPASTARTKSRTPHEKTTLGTPSFQFKKQSQNLTSTSADCSRNTDQWAPAEAFSSALVGLRMMKTTGTRHATITLISQKALT